jgi:biotin/methionine sulfoxide reductase
MITAWAGAICGLPAEEIVELARRIVGRRTFVICSQSLQRAEPGEQPVWMGVVLAALLGQIGLPGGGFAYALGSASNTSKPPVAVPVPTLPQGRNSIAREGAAQSVQILVVMKRGCRPPDTPA